MLMFKKFFMAGVVVLLLGGIFGCGDEGPAEKAGKDIDKAMKRCKRKS